MPESPEPIQDKSKGNRIWLVFCASTDLVVNVTLNKYSTSLPDIAVIGLWLVPLALFLIWLLRVEKAPPSMKVNLQRHWLSYLLLFLFLIPVEWLVTAKVIHKLSAVTVKQEIVGQQSKPTPVGPPPADPLPQSNRKPSHKEQGKSKPSTLPSITPAPATTASVRAPSSAPTNPPTYEQECVGSACAQGPGSQATFNQFGPPPPPPLQISFSTKYETDPGGIYVAIVTISVNVEWHPVSLAIVCDNKVETVLPYVISTFENSKWGVSPGNNKIGVIHYQSPPLEPNVPLVMRVESTEPFKVLNVVQTRFY